MAFRWWEYTLKKKIWSRKKTFCLGGGGKFFFVISLCIGLNYIRRPG